MLSAKKRGKPEFIEVIIDLGSERERETALGSLFYFHFFPFVQRERDDCSRVIERGEKREGSQDWIDHLVSLLLGGSRM